MSNLWTSSETTGAPSQLIIEYKITNAQNQLEQKSVELTSTTFGSSTSEYTVLDYTDRDGKPQTSEVLTRKVDRTRNTIAAVSPGYVAWRLGKNLGLPSGDAISENITTSEYTTTVDGPLLVTETSDQYISLAQFAGGLQIEEWGSFRPSGEELVLSHRTIRRMDYAKTSDGRDVTRTLTERYIAAAESAEWKSYAARRAKEIKAFLGQFPEAIEPFVRGLTPLVYEGTEVQIETGRIPVPEKPSDQDIAAGEVGNGRGDIPSDATPGSWYGNDLGWPAYAPGGGADGNWQLYAVDSNNDGVPDWKEFVPDSYEDYDQDSNSDGIPDWADYVPAEEGGPSNWEEFDTDTNNDGVPDWADFVPVGDDFDTKDSDYSTSNPPEINNDKIITGIVLFNGQAFNPDNTTVTATYDMPFAPDDHFEYVKGIRKLVRGGATAAAQAFGLTESALDVGHAYGQNIVTGWNEAPTLDLSPIYVQIAGIEGAFLADSSSYAWGPEGMVVSSDLMLLGVSGWYGSSAPATSWLRLPVAVAGLTQVSAGTAGTPSKANSIAIPSGFDARNPAPTLAALPSNGADTFALFRTSQNIVGPTLTLEQLSVATGPLLIAREFEYALVLEPETAAIATGPSIVLVEFTALAPPVAVVSLAGLAPVMATGASVAVPAGAVSVAALAPVVRSARVVEVPAAVVAVAALVPEQVGRPRIEVPVPAGGVAVAGLAPVALTGNIIEVPAAQITITGLPPRVGGADFWSSWAQQNYGWWPESYGDWWAN